MPPEASPSPSLEDLAASALPEWKRAIVRPLASALGMPQGTVLFTLALFASLPVGAVFRYIPGAAGKNAYSLVAGVLLSVFAFGSSTAEVLVFGLASYAAMALARKHCGYIVFVGSFGYLIYYHATSASGEAWKAGNIDITGLLMVLTLKVTACALNYQDSMLPESELNDFQKKRAIKKLPNVFDYAGWLMFPCTLVVGPALEFRDYLDWLNNKGVWGGKGCPPVTMKALSTAGYALIFMCVHLYVMGIYTIDNTYLSPTWNDKPLWRKFWELHILGEGSRGKYFFCWVWAEAACIASGIGFSGYSAPEEGGKAEWVTAKNVRPMGVEKASTFVQIPLNWNIQTGLWLRHYVYDRTTLKGKKPGFAQLLVTQVVSGVWHGLYAGYWLFFVSSAVFVQGSKNVFRWQRENWPKKFSWVIDFPHWLLTTVGLNYLCASFMLVTYEQCVGAWGSVYFIPHLTVVGMCIFGAVMDTGKKKKPSLSKKTE